MFNHPAQPAQPRVKRLVPRGRLTVAAARWLPQKQETGGPVGVVIALWMSRRKKKRKKRQQNANKGIRLHAQVPNKKYPEKHKKKLKGTRVAEYQIRGTNLVGDRLYPTHVKKKKE